MKTVLSLVAGLLALVLPFPARAQLAGSVDPSFTTGVASISGGVVNVVLPQPDGQILIAGTFTHVGGQTRNRIARLNPDGSLEDLSTFNPGAGIPSGEVFCMALQSDGKILLGGSFTTVNTQTRNRIARLNGNGSLEDTMTFNPGTGVASGDVRAIAVQPGDGAIILGGNFASISSQPRANIARLNSNGSVQDTVTFNIGAGTTGPFGFGTVSAVAVQPANGKIVIGGQFTSVSGQTRNRIARLNVDGTVEGTDTFNPGTGMGGPVVSLAVQGNGKILAGGTFTTVNDVARVRIARLESNGNLEDLATFNPGTGVLDGVSGGTVRSIVVQSDNKIVIGGVFTHVNGQACGSIARLAANGTVETPLDFNPGSGAGKAFSTASVSSVAVQPVSGKILLGGDFTSMNGNLRRLIARLHPSGVFENITSFNPGVVASSVGTGIVNAAAVQPDGKILIGGGFQAVSGQMRGCIARLHPDGNVEDLETFDPGSGTGSDSPVFAIAVQPDGKIVIGGQFTAVDGLPRYRLARLYPDGAVEETEPVGENMGFNPSIGAPGQVNCIAIQSDGSILIGGDFTMVGGQSRNGIARLEPDGDLDPTFDPGTGATDTFGGRVLSIAVQPNGMIVVGGEFSAMDGAVRDGIARLEADGDLDPAFTATGVNASGSVTSVVVQPDGQILMAGDFTTVNGTACGSIARLNGTDGSVEGSGTFNPGTGANSFVAGLALQADGKIQLTGAFSTVNGAGNPRPRIARLLSNGNVEDLPTFAPGTGVTGGFPNGVIQQADGRILILGEFPMFGGVAHPGIARLHNDDASETLTSPSSAALQWLRGGSAPEVGQVTFELSTNGGTIWTALGSGARIGGGWEKTGLSLPVSGLVRARGRTSGAENNGSSGLVEQVLSIGISLTPYQQWKLLHLGNSAAPDDGDPDFDGVATLVEYGLNTLPHVPGGSAVTTSLFTYGEGRRLRIFVPRNPAHNDVTVEVRAADDLAGPWTTIATSTLGAPFSGPGYVGGDSPSPGLKTVEIRDIVNVIDEPKRFLLVRVTP